MSAAQPLPDPLTGHLRQVPPAHPTPAAHTSPEPTAAVFAPDTHPAGTDLAPPPPVFAHPRRVISFHDGRLTHVMLQQPLRCATVSEYARATDIAATDVIEAFAPWVASGAVALELAGHHVFVHTAPLGRPAPQTVVDVPANLWERLRTRLAPVAAMHAFDTIRTLERAGWAVDTSPAAIDIDTPHSTGRPLMAIHIRDVVVPVMPLAHSAATETRRDVLVGTTGLLEAWQRAGVRAGAILAGRGELDQTVTLVRRWMLARAIAPSMWVVVLEAPGFGQPVFLGPDDGGVIGVSTGLPADGFVPPNVTPGFGPGPAPLAPQ